MHGSELFAVFVHGSELFAYTPRMERNPETEDRPLTRSLVSLIGSLMSSNPRQAARVCVSLVLQRDGTWASGASGRDAVQICDGLWSCELVRAARPVLAGLDPDVTLNSATSRAWTKSLLAAWYATIGTVPPCNSPWRALRLAVAVEEGPDVSTLARGLGIPYANVYGRVGRLDLAAWGPVLLDLAEIVPGVVGRGQDSARNHQSREGRPAPEREARGDHSRSQEGDVGDSDRLTLHPQHPPDKSSAHSAHGTCSRLSLGPPSARLTWARRSEPST